MPPIALRRISKITVSLLFGIYNYHIDMSNKESVEEEKIAILYGDNGSGKSTLLKLAFHMLAPDKGSGHKTFLLNTEFKKLAIEFNDGTIVQAEREQQITGSYKLSVNRANKESVSVTVYPNREKDDASDYLHNVVEPELQELGCTLYLLSDDRTIQRAGGEPQNELSFRNQKYFMDQLKAEELALRRLRVEFPETPEVIAKQLLKSAIEKTEDWFRRKTLGSSTRGDSDVNELYTKILKKISDTRGGKKLEISKDKIEQRINKLAKESQKFSKYGLLPEFDGKDILKIIFSVDDDTFNLIVGVLSPYLDSIETKFEAMKDSYERIDTFVTVSSKFYTNKILSYDLRKGIHITSSNGKILDPGMLSSGERHLLLLFCTCILTGGSPSILMIDEPEISLNIKWQRMLIDALIQCIGQNDIQFIFSTHSLEILAKHKSRVVKLENING